MKLPTTVAHNCHIKYKFPTSKSNLPHQTQIRHNKNKFPTSKSNLPHQTQIRHNKSKIVTTKANSPHQKRTCHIKTKFVTAKTNSSHQNQKHRLNGQRSMSEIYLQFSLGLHPTAILFLHMVLLSCSGCIAAIAGEVWRTATFVPIAEKVSHCGKPVANEQFS